MIFNLTHYSSIIFDCDGVILDSNRVKTEGFRYASSSYGNEASSALVDYHISNGGVSRYLKFLYFLESIVPHYAYELAPENPQEAMKKLLSAYAQSVRSGLMQCAVADGLKELREATRGARWLIVSGGDQEELRAIFAARGLASYFDGGIMGSPATKDEIFDREKNRGNITEHALFLGDSRYDYQAAKRAGLDFIFVSGWSEVKAWPEFAKSNNLAFINKLSDLVPF